MSENRKYFGTDGIRGPCGGPVINEDFAARLGVALGRWLKGAGPLLLKSALPMEGADLRSRGPAPSAVLIGRDTRFSAAALEKALAAGLAPAGRAAVSLGVLPTPAVARAVRTSDAVLGIVVTASHNPATDNGIKIFDSRGRKLSEGQELEIERLLPADAADIPKSGDISARDGAADYVAAASRILPPDSLKGWRIVLDTANGAASATSPATFRALGAQVISIGAVPDGRNINAGVGSEHPAQLSARVVAEGARLGVAHDGDGDRCILCDERGGILDGDEILAILATHALGRGQLARNVLVVTVHSNLGVDAAIAAAGGRVLRTPVGDRHVFERMAAEGASLGGESSGHIIFSEISPTGDGLIAALKVIEVMLATGRPLSELRRVLKKFPQASRAMPVQAKRPLETLPALAAAIAGLEAELGARGRVLARYSGTEAKLRLLVEGPDDQAVQAGLARLEAAARADGL